MYDRQTFRTLLDPAGQALLLEADRVEDGLTGLTRLRRRHDTDLATLAHLTACLRRKAHGKFAHADAMYFLPEALEQATPEPVARYKAKRFAGTRWVVDLGCGIGGDAQALADEASLIGVDLDGLRLMMARENVAICRPRFETHWVQADMTAVIPGTGAFHWDPSRRHKGRRFRRGSAFLPPLSFLNELVRTIPDGALCFGPATPLSSQPEVNPVEVEAISWQGECKDTILWIGALCRGTRRATRLPEEVTLTATPDTPSVQIADPSDFVGIPDPAAIRAHLIRELADSNGAWLLDPHIALLTTRSPRPTPWIRYHQIQATFPFSRPRLRAELAARGLDRVRYSFHGAALQEASLPGMSRRQGPVDGLVFLVRTSSRVLALLAKPSPHRVCVPEAAPECRGP